MIRTTDVFVSYKAEDRARLLPLVSALEAEGFSVWWDSHIGAGARWREDIEEHLDAAKCVIVAWSKRSVGPTGDFVRDEASRAQRRGVYLPIRLDPVEPPLGFGEVQAISLRGWKGDRPDPSFQALAEIVHRRIAGEDIAHVKLTRDRPGVSRRAIVAGGASAIALAAGGAFLLHREAERGRVPPEVAPLLAEAKQLGDQNTREGQNQAIGLYQRVVQIAPQYADGWGWLGYAYGALSHFRERPEALSYKAKAEAAGRHALELDPDSAFGELALFAAVPFVGHWVERDRHLMRALALRPHEDEVLVMVAAMLQFVGRSTEAVPLYSRVKHRPFTPGEYFEFLRALWSAGRLAELDQAIGDAASLYPTEANIWFTRVDMAVYGDQTGAVSALIDPQSRPTHIDDKYANSRIRLARAIQSRDPTEAEAIMTRGKVIARLSANDAEDVIKNASALGRLDDAFMLAEAYYFGRGFIIPDQDFKDSSFSPEQRQTRFLFEPETKPMRADPRFEPLVRDLGLDQYWRESGHPPDYRHIAGL